MATGAAGGRTGQLCNRLRFNSGFLCTSRILKDLLANRAGVVFIIAGFCISRSLGFGLGQTILLHLASRHAHVDGRQFVNSSLGVAAVVDTLCASGAFKIAV